MKQKTRVWFVIGVVELSYIATSTVVTMSWGWDSFNGEILKAVARAISLIVNLILYRKYFKSSSAQAPKPRPWDARFLLLAILLVSIPALTSIRPQQDVWWLTLFTLGSVLVGFREELVYRVLVQSSLASKFPPVVAIFATTLLFCLYHVSYFLMGSWLAVGEVILFSLAVGVIYQASRSFLLVALIHSVYDGIYMANPLPGQIFSQEFLIYFLLLALGLSVAFFWKSLRRGAKDVH